MPTTRQRIQEETRRIVSPVLTEIGVNLVDVEYSRRGQDQTLRLFLDRPGGITVDELQSASREMEKVIEVSEIFSGHYRLEVSSPGLDRPLKNREDFANNIGRKVNLTLFSPLPDGRRRLGGNITNLVEDEISFVTDQGQELTVALSNIARAKPEIDWEQLLKQPSKPSRKRSHARRTS